MRKYLVSIHTSGWSRGEEESLISTQQDRAKYRAWPMLRPANKTSKRNAQGSEKHRQLASSGLSLKSQESTGQ